MTTSRASHDIRVVITPSDIDGLGHVNNASYLRWVQDAVVDHWQRFAPRELLATHLWVAIRHEINYRKPAFLEDDILASVLLARLRGARATYDTIIRRGGEVIAEVTSSWCCVDAATRRPIRLSAAVIELFLVPNAALRSPDH